MQYWKGGNIVKTIIKGFLEWQCDILISKINLILPEMKNIKTCSSTLHQEKQEKDWKQCEIYAS